MANNRARGKAKAQWNYEQFGCFGLYACADNLPIEFISTTLQIDELSKLSYAKDVRTDLDFELLIQRDIDEKRAVEEISKYISPENGSGYGSIENNGVFLPPLVAAIVNTNDGKTLSNCYPNVTLSLDEDTYGKKLIREWDGLFKVTMFEQEKGVNFEFTHQGDKNAMEIDTKNVHIEFSLGHENEKGARLVVIDGQHRLYALNYLRHHSEHKDKIKNLIIPICILYSSNSTEEQVKEKAPSIPDVLRKLFIDVNNNAKTVSGHFKILLADDDVGKIACSSLCSSLLNTDFLQGKSLSLIEWNTKTDKESKTISKPYTLSSIGVIYDSLSDLFKTKNGKQVLKYVLNIEEIAEQLDFGLDGDGEPKPQSADFPWRDIPYNNKDDIREQVRKYLTPCIQHIFFNTKFYSDFIELFFKTRKNSLESLLKERSTKSLTAETVLEHLDQFTELDDKASQQLFSSFIDDFMSEAQKILPDIVRTNVFQKGVLTAWFTLVSKLIEFNLRPLDITKLFSSLIEEGIEKNLFENTINNLYIQDSIYDGIKIKPSKESRNQISRLIISSLGNASVVNKIIVKLQKLDEGCDFGKIKPALQKLGEDNGTYFANSLHSTRIKEFTKGYRSNTELGAIEIQELIKFEDEKTQTIKAKRTDSQVKVSSLFDDKIKHHINVDFKLAIDQLSNVLGYTSVFDELLMEENLEE